MNNIEEINKYISQQRNVLLRHPLYSRIKKIEDLQIFTEVHVYAVWDFMSLLKALQIHLTCTTVPWFASERPDIRYLINEIVVAEESDEYIDGRRLSHFEMYLDAMETMGADTQGILSLIANIRNGRPVEKAISESSLDERIQEFLLFTFQVIATGEPHKIAAAFTFGREDLIPDMFTSILTELQTSFPDTNLDRLIYYFQRHIELDGDEHGPLAMKMIQELGGEDSVKWEEMKLIAREALEKRAGLWDAVLALLPA